MEFGGESGGEIVRTVGLEATMADGVVLVADAWCPVTGGPWPVLLQRLPYGRSVASTPVLPHPAWFARHGYAVIVQDCRGRGDSTGAFAPFVDEAADGAASIEWAARLGFCDGRVATYGFSYQGLAQLYAAAEHPPSLRAIAPMMCCPDPYEGWTYEGGLLRWPFACFWAAQLQGQQHRTGPVPFDTGAVPISGALGQHPPAWFGEWLAHPGDDEYWAVRRPDLDAVSVPAFTVMGWFDDFSSGTATLIMRLRAEAWCGPWAHMPWGTRHGGFEFGPEASPAPVWDALVAFFDRAFDRPPAPVGGDERPAGGVNYFVLGDGWRQASTWPPPRTIVSMTGSSATGNANSRWGDGMLVADSDCHPNVPTTLVSEPRFAHPGDPVAFQDDAPAQDRRDVACFTTAPASAHIDITGSPVVRVVTTCDRPRHDMVATLSIVDPDGTARTITGYAQRLLEPVAEGNETSWAIQLRPIAVRVRPDQQLRLSLSGARFPCYDRNAQTSTHDVETTASDQAVATIVIRSVELDLPVAIASAHSPPA
ncbi:MAG: CocE/NonD family hydrolase [Actinomycetota bacterium]